jgi:hypothetical protein
MPHAHAPDSATVDHWLVTAQLVTRVHWDLLVFVYRHSTSLVSADHIARLLGYATGEVVAALEYLASLAFVARSRPSHGVRLYQFSAPVDTSPGDACHRLLRLADSRAVRLRLAQRWRDDDRSPPDTTHAAAVFGHCGGPPWRKAS